MLNITSNQNFELEETTMKPRMKTNINYTKPNYLFEHENWNDVLTASNTDEAYNNFLRKFKDL